MTDDVRRGVEASQVLQNAVYKEAFQVVEQKLISELAQAEITPQRAEYLRQLLVMGRKYRQYIENVVVTGKMAEERQTILERVRGKLHI